MEFKIGDTVIVNNRFKAIIENYLPITDKYYVKYCDGIGADYMAYSSLKFENKGDYHENIKIHL